MTCFPLLFAGFLSANVPRPLIARGACTLFYRSNRIVAMLSDNFYCLASIFTSLSSNEKKSNRSKFSVLMMYYPPPIIDPTAGHYLAILFALWRQMKSWNKTLKMLANNIWFCVFPHSLSKLVISIFLSSFLSLSLILSLSLSVTLSISIFLSVHLSCLTLVSLSFNFSFFSISPYLCRSCSKPHSTSVKACPKDFIILLDLRGQPQTWSRDGEKIIISMIFVGEIKPFQMSNHIISPLMWMHLNQSDKIF